ncbi:hypothetical protein FHU13_001342 [Methylobacterium sp. R2-1]|nr:hypothetical protein [Methylobacterium sp. R2-1]
MSQVKSTQQDKARLSFLMSVIFYNIPAAFRVAEANGLGTAQARSLSKVS